MDEKIPEDPQYWTTESLQSSTGLTGRIGAYRIIQKLGEGGMGEVYEAEQEKPIRRKVALKVIRAGMDSKQIIARFESERQALALMDHPNIAKVFDAGATRNGRPFFAMEFVRGVPITEHCDRQCLSTRERLDLFRQVCEGVQHAHQNAIIHRDIKPSNVLVTIRDGKVTPKIIDFGVAKATAQRLTDKTLFTELGQIIGTPEYMSPEQAEMTGQSVDTRTDVYSLGVLLYELLVGALPFDPKDLRSAGFDEMRRRIREEEPSKPSIRVSFGDESGQAAKNRSTVVSALVKELRGDLDWITLKALEKDRTRRYGSPDELAADIGRHLRHEPVLACPPSTAYRASKFVRRHRIGVAVTAAAALFLVGFAVRERIQATTIATERDRANQEAATAQQVSEFLIGLFEVSDPSESRGNTITAREILDKGAEEIASELGDQPLVQARLMDTIGRVYQSLGLFGRAAPLLEDALDIRRFELGEDHLMVAESLSRLGWLRLNEGRLVEAEQLHRRALAIRERDLGNTHVDTGWSLYHIAVLHAMQGSNEEAEDFYTRALTIFESEDPNHLGVAWCLNDLGNIRRSMGDIEGAMPLFQRALEIKEHILGADHPDVARALVNLASIHVDRRNYDRAGELLEDAVKIQKLVYTSTHPDVARSLSNLAQVKLLQGNRAEAERLHQSAMEVFGSTLGLDHPFAILNQAYYFALVGERTLALDHLRRATAKGFPNVFSVHSPALDSLRGDPDFEAIVAEARENQERTSSGE